MTEQRFCLDGWCVDVAACRMQRDHDTRHLEPKVMKTLATLASEPGRVFPKDELLSLVWGHTHISDAALTRCIFEIRQAFGDDAKQPRIIETLPRVGYRLIESPQSISMSVRPKRMTNRWLVAAAISVCVLAVGWSRGDNVGASSTPFVQTASANPAAQRAYERGYSHYIEADYLANANAITFFQRAVELDPSFALAHTRLADALTQLALHWGQDRLDEAMVAARASIALNPSDADAYSTLGLAHLLRNETEVALDILRQGYELDPTHWKSMYNAAMAHKARLEHDEAISLFRRVVELAPSHFEAAGRLGSMYVRTGDVDSAEFWLQNTLEYAPEHVMAWTELATLELVTREPIKAIESCQRVLDNLPTHRVCLYLTGVAHLALGDADNARNFFNTVVEVHKGADYARLGLAQVLIDEGQHTEGMEAINGVLDEVLLRVKGKHRPRYDYRLIAACYSMLGDSANAIAWLDKTAETGRLFPLWDATDPVFANLHGDQQFNRFIATAMNRGSGVLMLRD